MKNTYNKSRRPVPHGGNNVVYTPEALAQEVVEHFLPQITGKVLDPCAGEEAFGKALAAFGIKCKSLEIQRGQDFLKFQKKVDWIVTNPPWGDEQKFGKTHRVFLPILQHACKLANDIVFVMNANAVLTTARVRAFQQAGFSIAEIKFLKRPKSWTPMGIPLVALHLKKGNRKAIVGKIT